MAYWSKIPSGDMAGVKEHMSQTWALFAINAACSVVGGPRVDECALYRKNPDKHADAENILPGIIERTRKAQMAKQIRQIMGGRRAR